MALSRPSAIIKPFANSGSKNTIPIPSQVGITDGAASFETGFPPATMVDISLGGIGPDGMDMNGILYSATEHIRFLNAGGVARFNSTLSTEIGGYPVGVVLQDDAGVNLYLNILAGNTTNFNTTPASIGVSWILQTRFIPNVVIISASGDFTVPPGTTKLDVELWGAGGGGGGSGSGGGTAGGGGGGGYAREMLTVAPGDIITCTVGAGGAAGGVGGAGGSGGTTSFGSYLSATGGGGGQPNPSGDGGGSGSGVGGSLNVVSSSGSSGSPFNNQGGTGGSAAFGGGGGGGATGLASGGSMPGGGGGGSGTSTAGSTGGAGLIIVRY